MSLTFSGLLLKLFFGFVKGLSKIMWRERGAMAVAGWILGRFCDRISILTANYDTGGIHKTKEIFGLEHG